jgi:hypothetical protein
LSPQEVDLVSDIEAIRPVLVVELPVEFDLFQEARRVRSKVRLSTLNFPPSISLDQGDL